MRVSEAPPVKPSVIIELSNHEALLLHNILAMCVANRHVSDEGRTLKNGLVAQLGPFVSSFYGYQPASAS